ncbi:MAG: Hsp20/alpha crystallin family protein [bacterium]|nr:Hsp20/alpha crystallin family protein [bacterium]
MAPEFLRRRGRELMPRPIGSFFPSLREQMDRMSRMIDEFFGMEEFGPPVMWAPPIDISETDHQVIATVDLPGVKPEDIDVSVSEDTLTIRGEKQEEREEEGRYTHFRERRYGSFSRTVELPASVDSERVNATYRNGVLRIEMQKSAERARKKIPIKSE